MLIENIQVEEGFLDGLDLKFNEGLNVLIGPRGAGKTSIIELIRFCLGVDAVSEGHEATAREHALSILRSGEVAVTIRLPDRRITVRRSAEDKKPRPEEKFPKPLIYSQDEIEAVGLDPGGRLRILDGFLDVPREEDEEKKLTSRIRSLTVELDNLSGEIEQLEDRIRDLESIPEALEEAKEKQEAFAESLEERQEEQELLEEYSDAIARYAVRENLFERAEVALKSWFNELKEQLEVPPEIPEWTEAAGDEDLLEPVREEVDEALEMLHKHAKQLAQAASTIEELSEENQEKRLQFEKKSRELRSTLEELKEGSGEAARRVSDLKEKMSQFQALKDLKKEKLEQLENTRERRGQLLSDLDKLRNLRFSRRAEVAKELNERLMPEISVSVDRGGYSPGYVSAIRSALRGSGLHYNTLAPEMAQKISPRELAELVESGDAEELADLVGIGTERAQRVTSEIIKSGTEDILTAQIEDSVKLGLLDGSSYKPTSQLSTGQRCTVVLSILLNYRDTSLIVDQPEDHLDNAFVVETLIESIHKTKTDTQLIFASHNANIPVLGDAERVISLGSDGKRGFVRHAGSLDEIETVKAITTVMEGGHEAFKRRAEFYGDRLAEWEAE